MGRAWSQGGIRFVTLQGLRGIEERRGVPPAEHLASLVLQAQRLLRGVGMELCAVARTWLYLDRILEWYGELNQVRSSLYDRLGLGFDGAGRVPRYPASTGVGARGHGDAICTMDLLAVDGDGAPPVRLLSSPVQPEPWRYGSAFSRGAVVELPRARVLHVSGTAAIDAQGRTVAPGDARAQIRWTLEAVERLLAPEGAGLQDICAATAFVKHASDARLFLEEVASRGLEPLPAVCVVADLCREDLLFELDAEVVVAAAPSPSRPLVTSAAIV